MSCINFNLTLRVNFSLSFKMNFKFQEEENKNEEDGIQTVSYAFN